MDNNNERPQWVEFEEFCNEASIIHGKGQNLFDYFSFQKYRDDKGEFFMPRLDRYVDGQGIVTGNKNGYLSREKAIAIMGKCLDVIANEKETKAEQPSSWDGSLSRRTECGSGN